MNLKSYGDGWGCSFSCSVCAFQASHLISGLEDEVKKGISTEYGKDDKFSNLWNATMGEVLYFKGLFYSNVLLGSFFYE